MTPTSYLQSTKRDKNPKIGERFAHKHDDFKSSSRISGFTCQTVVIPVKEL